MVKSQRPTTVDANTSEPIENPVDVAARPVGDVTSLDGDEFLAVNRSNRERLRGEAQLKSRRRPRWRRTGEVASAADAEPDAERSGDDSARGAGPGIATPADRIPGKVVAPVGRSRLRPLPIVLSVLVIVLAVATGFFAYPWVQAEHGVDAAGPSAATRQEAMDTAREYAATVATYDPANYDDLDRRIREISTPEFAKTYITSSQDARRGNATARGTSRAESKEAGLQPIADGKAVVLVTLDQTVTSPQVSSELPDGIPYQSRVKITLVQRDGRWLLDDLDTV